jgi:hypothetical protein
MPARKSASSPTPAQPAGDDFESILAEAEARIAGRTADLNVEDRVEVVRGEIVNPPSSKENRTVKQSGTKSKSTALAPKAVAEPTDLAITEAMAFGGVTVPYAVNLTNRSLSELEGIIQKGLETVFQVGAALAEINARALYREAGFTSFEKYLNDKWNMSKARGYQSIKAVDTAKKLVAAGVNPKDLPTGEAPLRQLEGVANKSPQDAVAVIAKAKELGGGKITVQSANEAAAQVGQGRSAGTVDSAKTRATKRNNTSNPGSKPAAPASKPSATGLEPVRVEEGRDLIGRVIKSFMNGTFVRNDNADRGTVAMMRTLKGYVETWLAGTANTVEAPDAKFAGTDSVKQVVASLKGEVATAAAEKLTDRKKGESAEDYAKRILANQAKFDTVLVGWARSISALPASKEEMDARNAAAAEVAPEAKALMAETKAARPQTGTDKRRAAEKAAAAPAPAAKAPAAKPAPARKAKAA